MNADPLPPAASRRDKPELVSIVVPLYNEDANVGRLVEAITEALPDTNLQIVLVDDGSTDDTFQTVAAMARQDARICGVSLARNFGHQNALAAGLSCAAGQTVIMMDGDMQHPPELLVKLIERWQEGYNVVQARRIDTTDIPWAKRTASTAFYRIFSWMCGVQIDSGLADFRLIDRTVADELGRSREGDLFLRGLIRWMGYRQAIVPFEVQPRHAGKSKYTLTKMLRLARSGIISFSSVPLRLGIGVGLLAVLVGLLTFAYLLVAYLSGKAVSGPAGWIGLAVLMFGVLCILIGLQGEYLMRIFHRVQNRPTFLIESVVRAPVEPPEQTQPKVHS